MAAHFIFRNKGEDVGKNPLVDEDGNPITPEEAQEENTQSGNVIQVGDTIAPLGEFANIRSEMEVDDGWFHNKLRKVFAPNPIGVVTEVNTVGNWTWYRVDMEGQPVEGNTAWDVTPDGYVRADVVKKV